MSEVSIENCLKVVPNKFDLVLVASQRTKELLGGSKPEIPTEEKEKKTVIALKEIEERKIDIEFEKNKIKEEQKNEFLFKKSQDDFIKKNSIQQNFDVDNDLDDISNSNIEADEMEDDGGEDYEESSMDDIN